MCVASSPSKSKACEQQAGRQKATLVSIRAALAAVRVRWQGNGRLTLCNVLILAQFKLIIFTIGKLVCW